MNLSLFARDVHARLERLRYLGRAKLDNLYLATVQKSGSQWMSAIFDDARMKAETGLVGMPQRYYEYGEHVRRFPKGFFVPGLYVSYQTFENFIEKPPNYKVIYVYRDPRDLVVSNYYSALRTHAPNPEVNRLRKRLKEMSKEDGISHVMKYYDKFSVLRSWVECGSEDPNVMFVRFEAITGRPFENFKAVLRHCGMEIGDAKLTRILDDYTKEKMRLRDLATRKNPLESHYRQYPSSHREEFTARHYQQFSDMTGNLVEMLGYS